MKFRINWRKEFRDWGIMILTVLLLYVTGLYTEVAGFAQRVILSTGVFSSVVEIAESDKQPAEYDFTLHTIDGKKFDFNDLKGKVVFINFWATWCSPCIAEMPGIQSLYENYSGRDDIMFVMISLDKDPEKARKYIVKKKYGFPVFVPDYNSGIPAIYSSPSIPTTFVISKEGLIDNKKVGMANYDTKKFRNYLDKLLGP